MKALELLKYAQVTWGYTGAFNIAQEVSRKMNLQDIELAIAELEELQSRSCESCRYSIPLGKDTDMIICTSKEEDEELHYSEFSKDFYCRYWENKE